MKMKHSLLKKILCLSVFTKAFAFKKGSLAVASAPISLGVYSTFKQLTKDIHHNDLALPVVTIVFCMVIYFVFFSVDFLWGMVASKYESKNHADWVHENKFYNSLGKIGGVLLVNFLLISVILFLVIIDFTNISLGFLIITVLLNTLAIMYEIHSIGENIKRRTGKKPRYLKFFDKMTSMLEVKIMKRVSRTIDPKGDDFPEGEG